MLALINSILPPFQFDKYKISKCAITNEDIVGVHRHDGLYCYYAFPPNNYNFELHRCGDCQPLITEADLQPKYAEWNEKKQIYVFFARNMLNLQMEKFVYLSFYQGFVQVDYPETKFNWRKEEVVGELASFFSRNDKCFVMIENIDGKFQKRMLIDEKKYKILPPKAVVPLKVENEERKVKSEFKAPLPPRPPFQLRCSNPQYVCVIDRDQRFYRKFRFHDDRGRFYNDNITLESDLKPKYGEHIAKLKLNVIHVFNELLGKHELYVFNMETEQLEEIEVPGVLYNESKAKENYKKDVILCVFPGERAFAIWKTNKGEFRKQKFCPLLNTFVEVEEKTVKLIDRTIYCSSSEEEEEPEPQPEEPEEPMETPWRCRTQNKKKKKNRYKNR